MPDARELSLTGRAAGPQRAMQRGLVEVIADQHQLGAARRIAPVAGVAQLGISLSRRRPMQCPVRRESRLREHSHSDWQTVTSAWAVPRRLRAHRCVLVLPYA